MSPDSRRALADLLIDARSNRRQIAGLPADLVPATFSDGYAVNGLVAEGLGWPRLGWKIAATNPVMMQRLRASEPIYGITYVPFETASPAMLVHGELLDPIVECEFFFRLGVALPPKAVPYQRGEVADAVAAVHAGIEIAECRFPLDRLPAMPAILADGAASGRYIVGAELADWRSRDLAAMPVALSVNGIVRRTGQGREVMDDPINALVWLANARSRLGDGLAAGALVSTGTATGMLLAKRGDRMLARFGDAAVVEVTFA